MEYMQFRKKVWDSLEKYKIDILMTNAQYTKIYKKRNSDEYREVHYGHILPEKEWRKNLLPVVNFPEGIKAHKDAHHLNSSQIMCINFFEPLTKTNEGKNILTEIIRCELKINLPDDAEITETAFEKVFSETEGTNFDFYIRFSDGKNMFFEIKYTEDGFGKANGKKESYDTKWDKIYKHMAEESLYLKGVDKKKFLKNYQINRNISYIKTKNDFCVFLYPFENGNIADEISEFSYENIFLADWRQMIKTAISLTKKTELHRHYKHFEKKYFSFC